MAEGIIALVVDNIVKVAATEIASLFGVTNEMENLSSELSTIKNVLQDAQTRQIGDEDVRGWVQKLKDVAYDLEDLLEEWRICFGDHQVSSSSSNLTYLIEQFKKSFRQLKYRERVDKIKSRLKQIATEKERYGFSADSPERRMCKKRRTDPLVDQTSVRRMRKKRDREPGVDETSVIGRDEDKKTLVTKLISEEGPVTCGSGSDNVPTIFVSGMGGLGKTTLAKSVFNDQRVKEHFDKCMWVCVGEAFNMEHIMKSMIESWGENIVPKESSRRKQLGVMLKDRKFLLILDDVWKVHYLQWKPLEKILNQGAKGSRIVITTRNTGVVAAIRSAYTHELKGLNEDECLLIFRKVVVKPGMEEKYKPLMDIGREIVGKCGGLPLAVNIVASAVRGRQPTRKQWEMVQNSKIWDLPQPDEGILPALMLSYTELTPQLKNCFGYCSIFKKDTLLEKDELISLWVSQGYIREEKDGEECIEELLARSMFQEPERDEDGTITRCKIHDLVHDLAQWVTKEECRIIGNDDANNNNNALSQGACARHCVVRREVSIGDINLAEVEKLRTLIFHRCGSTPEPIDTVLKSLKSVRVLKLRNCSVGSHSWEHLGKLVHLRYLNVEGCRSLVNLPKTIVSLPHLQVINLDYCSDLKELPELKDLSSLRQLNVSRCYLLVNLPKTIVSLPHLQVINLEWCSSLKELPELKDLLSLRQLNVKGCTSLVNLPKIIVSLPDLEVINLGRCYGLKELPELKDLSSLRELNVSWCTSLVNLPKTIVSLPHLEVINLEWCSSLKELPELKDLLSLRQLNVEGCTSLVNLPKIIVSLPDLQVINLSNCSRLEELPKLEDLPRLRELNVSRCGSLVNLPKTIVSLPHLQVINLSGCSYLKELPELKDLSSLRELNVEWCTSLVNLPKKIVSLPDLQVVNLGWCFGLKELPEFEDLSSLRELNVEGCKSLVNLPKTIVSLPHLELINLEGCSRLEELPGGIFEITSLRRLNVQGCSGLKKLPNGIQRQKDVVVILDRFPVVAASRDAGGGCSHSNIGELGGMNIRTGIELRIFNLEEVGSRDEARTAKLEERTSLCSLHLYWKYGDTVTRVAADDVLEGLRPPPSLDSLTIIYYPGQTFPSWMGDGGAAFRRLQLWKCKSCNQLPPLGQLPCLASLTITGLDGVERVGREFFGGPSPPFPCLKSLTFDGMRNWSEWVALSPISSEGEEGSAESPIMPALETLSVSDCPKLEAMPPIFTTSLRSLIIKNCPKLSGRCRVGGDLWPKIAHIPLIRIDGQDIRSA